jgi:hypothetical protein
LRLHSCYFPSFNNSNQQQSSTKSNNNDDDDVVSVDDCATYSLDTQSDTEFLVSCDDDQELLVSITDSSSDNALAMPLGPNRVPSTCEAFHPPHQGTWHATFSDCSYIGCGWGLKSSVGHQHYSCCFATSRLAWCNKLGPLVNPPSLPPVASPLHSIQRDAPRYVVHLDAPVKFRWRQIIQDYMHRLPALLAVIDEVAGENMAAIGAGAFTLFTHLGVVFYGDELRAIANQTKISLGKLAMLQVAYEYVPRAPSNQ